MSPNEIEALMKLSDELDDPSGSTEGEIVVIDVAPRRNLLHPKSILLTHRPETCPRCGGDLEEETVDYMSQEPNGRRIMIRDVASLRCRPRGHEFLLSEEMDRVDEVLQEGRHCRLEPEEVLEIPVFHLVDQATS